MIYTLEMQSKPVTPTLERWHGRKAAERGKRIWQRITGLRLRVKH